MSAMSNYLENKILDWLFRGQTFTPPTDMYVALFTAAPTQAGGGTEVSGGAYARVLVADSLADWAGTQSAGSSTASSGTSGTTSNNNAITFPVPTASWGDIVAFAIFDAATAGNMLFWADLTAAKNVNNGDPAPSFAAGALTVQIDN